MGRDLRNTPKQEKLFTILGDVDDPTAKMMSDLFGRKKDKEPEYRIDDYIVIGPEQSKFVKPNTVTTIGIYIFNKFIIEPMEIFGYINKTLSTKTWEKIEDALAEALTAYDLTPEQAAMFIDRGQYLLGGPLSQLVSPSVSQEIMRLPPKAAALRKKLIAENKEALDANDPTVSSKIEKEVVSLAMEEMHKEGAVGTELFDSGAIDPYNNYRTMFVMKGAIKDNTGESPTGFKVITSNYDKGITKEDMPKIADSLVTSSYMSGIATADSGTLTKKYNVIGQQIRIGEPGSDCGTKRTRKAIINDRYLYRYIVENGKLVLLDHNNIDKYIGKTCDLRTPIYCKYDRNGGHEYCSKCVGERPHRVGNVNIGITFMIMSGSTMNAALKTKHDVTVHYQTVGVKDITKHM